MPSRTYYEFILVTRIELDEWNSSFGKKTFTVQVFDSPAGQQPDPYPVEIPDYDCLQNQVGELEDRGFDGNPSAQKELGTLLADLLLPEPVRIFLYRSLKRLRRSSDGLRIRLRLEPQLADLPWEFLYLPLSKHSAGGFLALDPRLSIVRHEELPIPVDWPLPSSNLRIVLAMASPEPYNTYPKLTSLPLEQHSIKDTLRDIKGLTLAYVPEYTTIDYPDEIPGATLNCLYDALKTRTDILHFSGHGMFKARSGRELNTEVGKSFIILANKDNQACEVSAQKLAEMVENKGVRLLYLSACETCKRRPYKDAEGFTYELLTHKIPCVLAMQFRVDDKLAATFTAALFQALVAGWTVDEAVSQGRLAMHSYGSKGRYTMRDWGAPVLYSRIPNGDLFRPVLDELAREEAERIAEQRARLAQAWWGWNGRNDTLATIGQLRNLEKLAAEIELSPFQILYLLRSAAKEWIPATPWVNRLCQDNPEWLKRLDDPRDKLEDIPEAISFLDLDNLTIEACPDEVSRLAWSAVKSDDQLIRQTAVLALVPRGSDKIRTCLLGAIRAVKEASMSKLAITSAWWRPLGRLWEGVKVPCRYVCRQSELYGTLAELDPSRAADYVSSLPPTGRISVRLWRFWRWFLHDLGHILSLTLGAGLAAGTVMGLLRGLYSIAGGVRVGAYMAISFFCTFVLAASLVFGRSLAEPMLLRRRGKKGQAPPFWRAPWHPDRRVDVVAVLLGTLFFGTAHVVMAWANDVFGNPQYPRELMVPAGYLVGLGLSLALNGMPNVGMRQSAISWILRLTTTTVFSVLAQLTVFTTGQDWSAMVLTYTGRDISDLLGCFSNVSQWIAANAQSITLADAALGGVILLIGISFGLTTAESLHNQWQVAVHHMQD